MLELEAQVERIERGNGREVGIAEADGGDRISERRGRKYRRHVATSTPRVGDCAGSD